jgi:hypothetical protein
VFRSYRQRYTTKAKKSPDFRFYSLYDKVYRKDVLTFAYECCKANGGAAGVDDQTFEDIEAYGAERWLDELAQELKRPNLSTTSRAEGIHTEAGRATASVRSSRYL